METMAATVVDTEDVATKSISDIWPSNREPTSRVGANEGFGKEAGGYSILPSTTTTTICDGSGPSLVKVVCLR